MRSNTSVVVVVVVVVVVGQRSFVVLVCFRIVSFVHRVCIGVWYYCLCCESVCVFMCV